MCSKLGAVMRTPPVPEKAQGQWSKSLTRRVLACLVSDLVDLSNRDTPPGPDELKSLAADIADAIALADAGQEAPTPPG